MDQHHPGKHWQRLEDGRLRCDICPRQCKLREGQRGLCFVRQGGSEEIELTTYGRSSGFCIDPVEKKPLNHFLPEPRSFPSAPQAATLAAVFVRTRTSANPGNSTGSPIPPLPKPSPMRHSHTTAAVSHSPTTTPSFSSSTQWTLPRNAGKEESGRSQSPQVM